MLLTVTACNTSSDKDDKDSVEAAEELIDDGDIDDAVEMLEALLDDDDEDWEAWEVLVKAHIEDEAYEDAADALEDMGKVIEDNYDNEDDDIEDAMETYKDLAEDIMEEDEDIEVAELDVDEDDEDQSDGDNDDEDQQDVDSVDEDQTDGDDEDNPDEEEVQADNDNTTGNLTGAGHPDIDIERNQMYFTFFEDGRLSMYIYGDVAELESDFEVDFTGDGEEIKANLQASLDESLLVMTMMLGLDVTVEITEVEVEGDTVYMEMVFSDFELVYMGTWFDSLDSLNEGYGSVSLLSYSNGMPTTDSEMESFDDVFIAILEDEGEGTYYEFPGDIVFVDDEAEFERISDSIIYIEPNSSCVVGVDADIEGEPIDIFGDMDFDSGFNEVSVGNPNDLQVGQDHIIYSSDGTYNQVVNISAEDFEWVYNATFTTDPEEIKSIVETYYSEWNGVEVVVIDVEVAMDSVQFTIDAGDIYDLDYRYGDTIADEVEWYGSYESYINSQELTFYDSGMTVQNPDELAQFADYYITYGDTYGSATYYTFPGPIAAVDAYMVYDYVDENTIYVHTYDYGVIIYQPE
jgi:hypothetical protein